MERILKKDRRNNANSVDNHSGDNANISRSSNIINSKWGGIV